MSRRDRRTGLYAEVSGRADAHRADMRERMRVLRASRKPRPYTMPPAPRVPSPAYEPPPPTPPVDGVLVFDTRSVSPTRVPDLLETLGRMLLQAEAASLPIRAESIRQRIRDLGGTA